MQKLEILNTREVKKIREMSIEQFGYFPEEDYGYLINDKGRIFLVSKEVSRLDFGKLRIDRMGLYFGELSDKEIRLSKEGAQLLAKSAEKNGKRLKNVVELDKTEMKTYFLGDDLEKDFGSEKKFVLLSYDKDVFGCAKYKERKIINFLPKLYRSSSIIL
jgi:NOL1/NOP2/fmu family ribosome biogenesis protein